MVKRWKTQAAEESCLTVLTFGTVLSNQRKAWLESGSVDVTQDRLSADARSVT